MNQYAVVTLCEESIQPFFKDTAFPTFRKYCEQTHSDFYIFGGENNINYLRAKQSGDKIDIFKWAIDGKHTFIRDLLKTYTKVLYIDSDILINTAIAPNIFECTPNDAVSVYSEDGGPECESTLQQTKTYYNIFNQVSKRHNKRILDIEEWKATDRKYYNNGVYVIPRGMGFCLQQPDEYVLSQYGIQDFFNYSLRFNNIRIHNLGIEWNSPIRDYPIEASKSAKDMRLWSINNITAYNTEHYFLHFLGIRYDNYEKKGDIMKVYRDKLIELGMII